jgi:uncharacterized membrane protein
MTISVSRPIAAPVERVWSVLTDVERWPESTASVTSVRRLDDGPLQRGSRAQIKQPRLPALVWTVTDVVPLSHFTWSTTTPGVTTNARHVLTTGPSRRVTVMLSIERSGFLEWLTDLFYTGMTRRYLTMEIEGLKRVCETQSPATSAWSHHRSGL